MFTVYHSNGCTRCRAAIKWLRSKGALLVIKEASSHAEELTARGLTELPVVVTPDGEYHSGFRPDAMLPHLPQKPEKI